MKGRESGMPEESLWTSFFDAKATIEILFGPEKILGDVIEFGCGFGTFTFPAALHISGIVTALDIEPEMVACVILKAKKQSISNIQAKVRDFVVQGTGVCDESQAHAMIFNLLHLENPVALLREAYRVLRSGATLSIIHWRSDISTPRGPPLSIRPQPEQCWKWLEDAGFINIKKVDLQHFCPYHFGIIAMR